jgi:flagellar hook-basal body complex protein FliE
MDNNINQVLSQMRSIEALAKSQASGLTAGNNDGSGSQFSDLMARAINQVNQNQAQAAEMGRALERGDPSVDIAEVMVAMQKSRVSFQALTEVRNKLLTAYQDIMNMPV